MSTGQPRGGRGRDAGLYGQGADNRFRHRPRAGEHGYAAGEDVGAAEPYRGAAAGRYGETPYYRDEYHTDYAPDEYSLSETGEAHHPGREIYDYEDESAAARAAELTRGRTRGREPAGMRRAGYGDHPQPPGYGRPDYWQARGGDFPGRQGYGRVGYGPEPEGAPGYPAPGYPGQGYRNHRGKGPRGYTRSDERIMEDVNERLSDDPVVDATDIEVHCENGHVSLEGRVPARWMKHRAEDIVDAIPGATDVDNRIRVVAGERTGGRAGHYAGPSDAAATGRADRGNDDASATGAAARGSVDAADAGAGTDGDGRQER